MVVFWGLCLLACLWSVSEPTASISRLKTKDPAASFLQEALRSQKFNEYFADHIRHVFLDENEDQYVFVVDITPVDSNNKGAISLEYLTQDSQTRNLSCANVKVNAVFKKSKKGGVDTQ